MKFFLAVWILLVLSGSPLFAQDTYIHQLPAIPESSCGLSGAEQQNFLDQVEQVADMIGNRIAELTDKSGETAVAQALNIAEKQLAGLNLDMKKIQEMESMSEAEQTAIAMQIAMGMQKKTGISRDIPELDGLVAKKQSLIDQLSQLAQERQKRIDTLKADADDRFRTTIKPLLDQLAAETVEVQSQDTSKKENTAHRINMEMTDYCKTFTPRYIGIVQWDRQLIDQKQTITEQLFHIEEQTQMAATGVSLPPEMILSMKLELERDHIKLYSGLFDYDLKLAYASGL